MSDASLNWEGNREVIESTPPKQRKIRPKEMEGVI